MNKISINKDSFKLDEYQLEHGSMTIGRATDNDLHLDDPALSSHHAKIVTLFSASHIEDMGSTNGTYVNGKSIAEHTLHSGDVITLGNYQIVFYSDHVTRKAPEKTMMMSSEKLQEIMEDAQNKKSRQEKMPAQEPIRSANLQSSGKASMPENKNVSEIEQVMSTLNETEKSKSHYSPVVANVSNRKQRAADKANADVEQLFLDMKEEAAHAHAQNNRYLYIAAAITAALVIAGTSVMILM